MGLGLNSLFSQASIGQSRTSTVNPLQWAMLILLGGLAVLILVGAPAWLVILVSVLLAVVGLLFCLAFVFFSLRNPDALRSETYSLTKLAIEKGLYGDSISGLREVAQIAPIGEPLLPGETAPEQGQEQ